MRRLSAERSEVENNQVMIGTVVKNNDPLQLGRIKVRIPYFHKLKGQDGAIEDDDLPWVDCGLPFNRYIEIGSKVYVVAENGDKQLLSYIGVVRRKEPCMLGIKYDDGGIYGGEPFKSTRDWSKWNKYFRDYISDSRKGDVIYNEHQDEKEAIGIIDRVGNWLKLVSPVNSSDNSNNSSPSVKGTFSKIVGGITGIFLRGIGKGLIQLIEKEGKSEVILSGGPGKVSTTDDITLSVNGACSINITDSAIILSNGSSSIKIDGTNITLANGSSSIVLDGSNITITNGSVSMKMAGNITVEDPSMIVNGNSFTVNAATSFGAPAGASAAGASGVESPKDVSPLDIDNNF